MAFKRVGLLMVIATGFGMAVLFALHSNSAQTGSNPGPMKQLTERDPVVRLQRSK